MKVLVANVGSTSYKSRLFDMDGERELAQGGVERVGSEDAVVSYRRGGQTLVDGLVTPIGDHREAVQRILDLLTGPRTGVIADPREIDAVGFKAVQAGEKNGSVLLTRDVTDAMQRFASIFPAHNPPYLSCIFHFQQALPGVPLVGVFEPGFHADIPEHARIFGVPWDWYETWHVQKYGFHGASFRYVTAEAVRRLGLDPRAARIIACHLGGSSSMCAFAGGRSVDTSFSFTTQSGLLQTARVGDLDPFVLPYIMEKKGITLEQALAELSTRGGLYGISGVGRDMREIKAAAARGNRRARLAVDKLVYDIVRYIGSYYVLLQGVDVIAFSGGMGLNDADLRRQVVERIAFLGVQLDEERNRDRAEGVKTVPGSPITVITVDTNEEIVVARETVRVAAGMKGARG
jgi:acetate kinase